MKAPRYDQSGELVCGECGKLLAHAPNRFGDSVVSCSDTGCTGNGQLIEEGSFRHNPALPENRRPPVAFDHPSRFYLGGANWIVKDGVKQP